MRRYLLRISPVLHLTRLTTAIAAVANVWFIVLWTRRAAPLEAGTESLLTQPLWLLLTGSALNALGLFAFAATLNDLLDARRDRAFYPDRPLPSGRVSVELTVTLVVGTLLAAILGATALGLSAVLLTIVVAIAILFFNAVGKFIPALGLVALGLIYAGQMVIPNLRLNFIWPVWLVMTHSLLSAAASHTLARKVPPISRRAWFIAGAGWLFWSSVMFVVAFWRNQYSGGIWPDWVKPHAAIGPVILTIAFVIYARRKCAIHGPGARSAEKVARYGSLWLSLYATAWCVGQGYTTESIILGLVALTGFAGMTVLREVYAYLEQPLGYRR